MSPDGDRPEDQAKLVRGEELDADEGTEVTAQQNAGPEVEQGGGEWPDPGTPAQPPAPGAVED